ncbi:MAG: hypothetical protein OXF50_16080 [Caldilineaceae bacterium]|nr:hypothetical protein [Caldilineaceae bacterium]
MLKPVFVSQPSWVPPEHCSGLDNFRNLLRLRNLDPRTVGVTDLPSLSPLDEVIQLMERCYGAIILGIPQIEVQSGNLKGDEITSPFSLGTEWNHIEAALAYSLRLPVLVIHDVKVRRGIFDRGAANAFIYGVDFSSDSWSLSDKISGALGAWCCRLKPE